MTVSLEWTCPSELEVRVRYKNKWRHYTDTRLLYRHTTTIQAHDYYTDTTPIQWHLYSGEWHVIRFVIGAICLRAAGLIFTAIPITYLLTFTAILFLQFME